MVGGTDGCVDPACKMRKVQWHGAHALVTSGTQPVRGRELVMANSLSHGFVSRTAVVVVARHAHGADGAVHGARQSARLVGDTRDARAVDALARHEKC